MTQSCPKATKIYLHSLEQYLQSKIFIPTFTWTVSAVKNIHTYIHLNSICSQKYSYLHSPEQYLQSKIFISTFTWTVSAVKNIHTYIHLNSICIQNYSYLHSPEQYLQSKIFIKFQSSCILYLAIIKQIAMPTLQLWCENFRCQTPRFLQPEKKQYSIQMISIEFFLL